MPDGPGVLGSDTIAAIATALGPAAVAIVRVSGPGALAVADGLYRTGQRQMPRVSLSAQPSHRVHHGWLLDPVTGAWLDEALVLVMRGPKSFTGEDVVEFQTHGGVAAGAVLAACLRAGARLAAPGEFSKRAFLNGRLDLAQAEALRDVVEAKTERALSQALIQLDGRLSREVAVLRAALITLLSRFEAAIDYPDEVDDVPTDEAIAGLDVALAIVDAFLATAHTGEVMREGLRLAIVGRPNAGKSSLLNALLGRERAIVTDVAGTTRDVLEETLSLSGVPFRIVDTAGIRDTEDVVEAIGVSRSKQALETAACVLLVVDLVAGVGAIERDLLALVGDRPLLVAANKVDQAGVAALNGLVAELGPLPAGCPEPVPLPISAATGQGLAALSAALVKLALGGEAALAHASINARHAASLAIARSSLLLARESAKNDMAADFMAIDLKAAIAALGDVLGDAIAEEVIDAVFANFCVGK